MAVLRLVLDVLKPIRGPTIVEVADRLSAVSGVHSVKISVTDMDVETMGLSIVIEGNDIPFQEVERLLEEQGCAIHSIDEAVAGIRPDERRVEK